MAEISNRVEYVDTKKLRLLEDNPRTINRAQFETLKTSLRDNPDFYEARPLIVSDRTGDLVVLAGNQRLKASKELKLQQVPAVILHGLTEEREKEIIIRDNVSNGDWDMDALANGWDAGDLQAWGVDLGIDEELTADDAKEVKDVRIDEQEDPKSKEGEIYQLGQHRLICGDSLKADTLERLLGVQKVDMILTDPPYNVNYKGATGLTIQNDNMDDANFQAFLRDAFLNAQQYLKEGGAFYIWHAGMQTHNFQLALQQTELIPKQLLIWAKNTFALGRQDYQWQHEPCLYGWKAGAAHYFTTDRTLPTVQKLDKAPKDLTKAELVEILEKLQAEAKTTLIEEKKPARNAWHPTTKPIALMARLVMNSTKAGAVVLDPFAGSGSTILACDEMGRTAFGVELDPRYCDVIRKRYQILKTGDDEGWEDATPLVKR